MPLQQDRSPNRLFVLIAGRRRTNKKAKGIYVELTVADVEYLLGHIPRLPWKCFVDPAQNHWAQATQQGLIGARV
jgi:hypothetical protein